MPEPFDALRRPFERVDPDPDFAAELRDNLRRLILNGADMTTTAVETAAEMRSLTPAVASRSSWRTGASATPNSRSATPC